MYESAEITRRSGPGPASRATARRPRGPRRARRGRAGWYGFAVPLLSMRSVGGRSADSVRGDRCGPVAKEIFFVTPRYKTQERERQRSTDYRLPSQAENTPRVIIKPSTEHTRGAREAQSSRFALPYGLTAPSAEPHAAALPMSMYGCNREMRADVQRPIICQSEPPRRARAAFPLAPAGRCP